jgi:murein tripeptide amidase MpaA
MKRGFSLYLCLAIVLGTVGVPVCQGAEGERPLVGPATLLPPALPWNGASRALVAPADDPWITPAEKSGLTRTPRYDETIAWLERLVKAAPELTMVSIGKSFEGRDIWMVVAAADGAATAAELHAGGKPVLLAHAGIHAGEIDGKDAGLMLLRDLTVRSTKPSLLDEVNLLFIPILNVDGHERFSPYGRINQRGPLEMGWRTNARNQNLNRDFTKLDTPELRALIQVFNRWQPDLYIDLHVTDGADYQYDITWGYNGPHAYSPAISRWLEDRFTPRVRDRLRAMGHVPRTLFFPLDGSDMSRGIAEWTATPRFSNGYGDARHLATVLVENHSLKPYDQRVLGTYVFLETALRALASHGDELRRASVTDRDRRVEEIPLAWEILRQTPPEQESFLGIEQRLVPSDLSGGLRVEWTGRPVTLELPVFSGSKPTFPARRPRAYWIPPTWPEVIERLAWHGIEMERLAEPRKIAVEIYRLADPEFASTPFEGHVRVSAATTSEQRTVVYPAGSVRVTTDQALGTLAVLLLEPESPDSFFQWGFFHEVFQRTEYAESYVLEPLAESLLEASPELADEFRGKLLEDAEFAADPRERLNWFYRQTPFFDERWGLYPVVREAAE